MTNDLPILAQLACCRQVEGWAKLQTGEAADRPAPAGRLKWNRTLITSFPKIRDFRSFFRDNGDQFFSNSLSIGWRQSNTNTHKIWNNLVESLRSSDW